MLRGQRRDDLYSKWAFAKSLGLLGKVRVELLLRANKKRPRD